MVDFVRLQEIIRERLDQDRNTRIVNTSGATLEDAVAEATVLLDIPMRRLAYEVTEKGSSGIFGQGKKNWTIKAYENISIKKYQLEDVGEDEEESEEEPVKEDADGEVFAHLSSDGAYLKVVPPRGNGRRVTDSEAMRQLHLRSVENIERELVSAAVKEASSEYTRVGDFEHRPLSDSMVAVEISDGEMRAYISVTAPGIGGCDISFETYISFLKNNRVVYGIKEDFLRSFADSPVYKEKVIAAEGLKPENGKSAYVQYNFEIDQNKIKLRARSDGSIDFRDINIIKNVVQNQPLAKKIPPAEGVNGRTVTGKFITAKDGKDIPVPLGNNVRLGDDGATIIADINGQVVLAGGKINVEPVYTVQGDVSLKTGNIIFLGTVIIKGNVEDGFSVKAAGNIEVSGTVAKAELDAEGDIIVHQGITGKNTSVVRAGNSLWARFIENTTVESGNMVVVSDGIINSQVDANKRITCLGKRGHIVGGRLRATEEINAKILGSPTSGTETICEVGIDPRSKLQFDALVAKKAEMKKQFDEIQLNIQTLINVKKQRKFLPDEKEAYLRDLMDKRQILMADLKKNDNETAEVQEFLNSLKSRGRVSASSKVFPGVKVSIKDAVYDVHTEYKAVTFILENNLIRISKYEEPNEEVKKAPDGYTAD